MSTINFLTPGFNKAGQNNLDNQGGLIGPENDPVINDLVTIFTSPGTFNRTKTEGTVLVVAGGGGAAGDGLNISPYFPGTTSIGTLNSPDGGYYVAGGGRGSAGSGPNGIGGGSSGQNGTSGGGGGSSYSNPGGTGGDGVVAVAEAGAGPSRSSGMWNLKAVYTARINDNWPS